MPATPSQTMTKQIPKIKDRDSWNPLAEAVGEKISSDW